MVLSDEVLRQKHGLAGEGTKQERFKNWAIFGTQETTTQQSFSMFTANETVWALEEYKRGLVRAAVKAGVQQGLEQPGKPSKSAPKSERKKWWARLREQQDRHPFCFFVSFYKPHPPVLAPEELYVNYKDKVMPRPLSLGSDTMHLSQGQLISRQALQAFLWENPDSVDEIARLYYSAVEEVDTSIGVILSALDQFGAFHNATCVVTCCTYGAGILFC